MHVKDDQKFEILLNRLVLQAVKESKALEAITDVKDRERKSKRTTKLLNKKIQNIKSFARKVYSPQNDYPFRGLVTCIGCGKPIHDLYPDMEDRYGMVEGGMVGRLYAPYGSENDGSVYQIGICDKCIKITHLVQIGDYMESDWWEITKKYGSITGT